MSFWSVGVDVGWRRPLLLVVGVGVGYDTELTFVPCMHVHVRGRVGTSKVR